MPRVEVEGAGTLSFPVPDAQIAAIVRRAKRAPYGRGQDTIVDTSVRKVWQIAPGKVKIGGKSWAANFETILSKVKAGLGCDDASVSAELYKLLVYDRGGFFLAHRDTEKADGMFGTLVVTLPSTYRGGALRIRHAGREVTVDTNSRRSLRAFLRRVLCRLRTRGSARAGRQSHLPGLQPHPEALEGQAWDSEGAGI